MLYYALGRYNHVVSRVDTGVLRYEHEDTGCELLSTYMSTRMQCAIGIALLHLGHVRREKLITQYLIAHSAVRPVPRYLYQGWCIMLVSWLALLTSIASMSTECATRSSDNRR